MRPSAKPPSIAPTGATAPSSLGAPPYGLPPHLVEPDVHILDRLNVLYKHRWLIVTVFLLVMIGVLVKTYTTVPMYQATSRLLIEDERAADERAAAMAGFDTPGNKSLYDPEPYYQTQLRILTGRDLARKVVQRLDLENVPEFNGAGPPQTDLSAVLSAMRRLALTSVRTLVGTPGTESAPKEPAGEEALTFAFLSRVSLEPVRNSQLVDVSFVSVDPAFAARAADAIADEYVKQNLEVKLQTTEMSLAWLSQEIAKQRGKVEASERAMAEYRETQDALSLEDRQNIVVARLNQLNDAVTRAKLTRVQKETLYNQLRSLGPTTSPDTILAVTQEPYIQSIKARLADLQRDKARLSERYGDKHPEIVKVNAAIQDALRQLQSELANSIEAVRNDYQSALAEERTLTAALEEQKSAAMDLNRKSVRYTVLQREAQSNRQVYESLLQREKELQVVRNSRGNNVRLMDRAAVPTAPFRPDTRRSLLLGALIGLALAIGLALGIEYLDDSIKTPEDITRKLKIPFLGLIPSVAGGEQPLLTSGAPHAFAEACRLLRTSLVFSSGSESTRVVLVTSAQQLEGKTTTACNLAIALAYGGARVLLIDGDMRRPSVHRVLALDNNRGLSDFLAGQAPATGVVQRLADPNLWVMTAGRTPPNPCELLASARMNAFMTDAQNGPFDWVIVDTPPVLAVADALTLTPWVSGVVFVIGAEMTHRRLAQGAIETLTTGKSPFLGAVLNRVDITRNKYYYARYYGNTYKRYYSGVSAA